jgi:predicted DNA-binding protein
MLYTVELAKRNSTVLQFSMARTDPQTNIRLPLGLKERLGAAARANTRTMNAEIVNRLEASFSPVEPAVLAGDEKLDIPDMLASIFGSLIGLQGQINDLQRESAEIKALITAAGGRGVDFH